MVSEIATRVEAELKKLSGQTARQLALTLGDHRSNINSCLYGNSKFIKDGSPRPCWFLAGSEDEVPEPIEVMKKVKSFASDDLATKGLRPWQEAALKAWNKNGCKGIVEAVTGTGKTRLAIAAIDQEFKNGGKVAIIVPTVELQHQWKEELEKFFPKVSIGMLSGRKKNFLTNHDVIIAIVHSASRYDLGLGNNDLGLLVADECHRYGAESFQRALEENFNSRLGITATLARPDGAYEELHEYFGEVIYNLGYREAIDMKYIADVKVAQIAVDLTESEQLEYDEMSESIRSIQAMLLKRFDLSPEPFQRFIEAVTRIADNGPMRDSMAAKKYLSSISKRRKLLANTPQKLRVIEHLVPAVKEANGAIFFTERIESAEAIAAQLNKSGINAVTIHSKLKAKLRRQILLDFKDGKIDALTAVKVLEEGIDVPEADLAVIIATSKIRRQMIQRMGRVLRPKIDGRAARFVLVYVASSSEDPKLGAHGTFLDEVIDIASASQLFSVPQDKKKLIEFLDPKTK